MVTFSAPCESFVMSRARYRPSGSDPSGICSTMACVPWSVEPALLIGLVLHAVRPPRAATAATATVRRIVALFLSMSTGCLPPTCLPSVPAPNLLSVPARKLPLRTLHRDTNGCRSPQTLALSCHEGKGEGRVTGVPRRAATDSSRRDRAGRADGAAGRLISRHRPRRRRALAGRPAGG